MRLFFVRTISYFVFVTLIFSFSPGTKAQTNNGSLKGMVRSNQLPLEGASVILYKTPDSSIVKTYLTEKDGTYLFENLSTGNYFITASYSGMESFSSSSIAISNEKVNVSVDTIELIIGHSTELQDVTVRSKKKFVERKIDRTIINPEALISNAGTTALEVLEKSPGVQVNTEGVISLRGRQGVVVFIDDKPTYMSQQDLATYLRSVPSGNIESIEIMTTPPAKYDAAGNSGIINIRMKKSIAKGFNGGVNLAYGQGKYARTNNSLNLNYRINKFNFNSNFGYSLNHSYQDLTIHRNYYNDNGGFNSAFNQNSYIERQPQGLTGKLGVDYYASNKLTLGVVLTGFSNKFNETTTNHAIVYDENEAIKNRVFAFSPARRRLKNGGINTNFTYKPDSSGKEINVNLDYIKYKGEQNNSLLNIVYNPNGTVENSTNLISDLPATIEIYTGKADYSHPLKTGAIETGVKTSFIHTLNTALFYDDLPTGLLLNSEFSNNFRYSENINAAYINYSIEKGRLGLQAGLRFENTNIQGNQYDNPVKPDSSFTREFNNLFPTLYLSYKLDSLQLHQLNLSLGRRIERPDYQDMNPFTYPLDRYTLYAGNPFLQPTFSYNAELSYTYKSNYTLTAQYGYVKDIIQETIEQRNNIFYSRPGNFGKQITYGISFNGMIPVTKWWRVQLYSEVTYNRFEATLYGETLNNKGAYWYIAPVNLFQLDKNWSAELAGTYQTKVYVGQFITIPVGSVRFAVARKIFKEKGTFKLSASDLFYTFQPGGDIKGIANSDANWKSYLDSRVISIAFSYRFSKGKTMGPRNTGGSDSEKGRVKT